jgi:ribosomal 50S subunit-associated protein YjgA (DUF615 family)
MPTKFSEKPLDLDEMKRILLTLRKLETLSRKMMTAFSHEDQEALREMIDSAKYNLEDAINNPVQAKPHSKMRQIFSILGIEIERATL